MTIKIQRADGVVIEAEGSAEDLLQVLGVLVPLQWGTLTGTSIPTWTLTHCEHQYPLVWNGIGPAPCLKCGR
jgi:hypothetical protein